MSTPESAASSFGELFAQFAAMASHTFWVYDLQPQEHVVYVSPSFERVWGRTAPELYQRHSLWMDAIHEDDRSAMRNAYAHWLNDTCDETYAFEFRIVRPDGGIRWIFEHGRRVADADGATCRVIGIAEDITDRKNAEAALRDSEQSLRAERDRLSTIAETAPGVLHSVRLTTDGRITFPYASPKIIDIYGLAPEVLQHDGGRAIELMHPDDAPRVHSAVEHSHRHLTMWHEEFRILHPQRGEIWVEGRSAPRREANGDVVWHGILTDITARKRAERQQLHSQKMEALGTLAGGIAHDFNNLLLAINGNTRLAMHDLPTGNAALMSLAEVLRASMRATDLVRQILSFSQQREAHRAVVQLRPIVEEALRLLRSTLPAMIRIESRFEPDLPPAAVDATQVHQVVMNLATNAAHAMEEGGTLEVSLEAVTIEPTESATSPDLRPGRYVRIVVSDSGSGMDRATLERIFDPFFSTKPAGQGTGLGLSVVHGIVRGHDGAINVYSEPDKGTTFRVYFPASSHVALPQQPAPRVVQAQRSGRIMYVDDEDALVFLGERVLERLGYRVSGYTDPAQALRDFTARPQDFDVVVTDLSMPGMSGFHLAQSLLEVRADLPIVMTTGYVRPQDRETARRCGVRELILKPDTIDELGSTLDRLLGEITNSGSD